MLTDMQEICFLGNLVSSVVSAERPEWIGRDNKQKYKSVILIY